MGASGYDSLVAEALGVPIEGWDFSWLAGRATGGEPSWSYVDAARALVAQTQGAVLDIDTGGGEVLASLGPFPAGSVAVEGWAPNVEVAARRLSRVGVSVRRSVGDALPAADGEFHVVLNRHGRLVGLEVARVLAVGGTVLTQQVGSRDCVELNDALGAPPPVPVGAWTAAAAVEMLTSVGLSVLDVVEEWPAFTFHDVGAVVFQLRAVPWQVPDFTIDRYDAALRKLHERMSAHGPLVVHAHRFRLKAIRAV